MLDSELAFCLLRIIFIDGWECNTVSEDSGYFQPPKLLPCAKLQRDYHTYIFIDWVYLFRNDKVLFVLLPLASNARRDTKYQTSFFVAAITSRYR